MPQPRIMLVVTGDDFGYCPKRNQGIVDCFKAGGISSVSLLVNASAAKDAADLAKRHKIPIGLHANLSEGIPVCQSLRQASTLVNEHGFFHGKIGFRQALERHQLSMKQVELELRDQIRLFRELTGYLPHHMDGHQHVHILQEVREVFAQVLSDHKIPFTRVPVEPGLHSCQWLPTHLQRFYAQVEKDALESIPVFRHYGIRSRETVIPRNLKVSTVDTRQLDSVRGSCGKGFLLKSTSISTVLSVLSSRLCRPHRSSSRSASCRYADSSPSLMRPMTVVSSANFQEFDSREAVNPLADGRRDAFLEKLGGEEFRDDGVECRAVVHEQDPRVARSVPRTDDSRPEHVCLQPAEGPKPCLE
ncbi:carbohydrate deacetylase isoform X2 [Phycodurus eques]|uniref:carbohydrate deacetylase isoform X2 n=1 Tax=Phycodurus eques TaxID=693459 RepID=UPI002ACE4FA3|nr:carbohydrate deacetylase isoform X2 [Phycodurus eques]